MRYPALNSPQSCFDALSGAHYFTSLDLLSAYWSVPLSDEDKEKTAFTLRSGKFEFNVMPFGLTNAVATFCALADHILSGLQWSFCLCFIDDCLIFLRMISIFICSISIKYCVGSKKLILK